MISSLFGLESFNVFVKNFSRELDGRYIDLVGEKGTQLKEKRETLKVHEQTIAYNQKELLTQEESEAKLANQYDKNISFSQMTFALGSDEKPGEIQALEAELQQNQPPLTGLTIQVLEESKARVESNHKKLTDKLAELTKANEGLSYKQLYSAVLNPKEVSEDKCPACKTPLAQATYNLYELAETELYKLGYLAQLEQERNQLQTEYAKTLKSVYKMVGVCIEHSDIDNEIIKSLRHQLVEDEEPLDWTWGGSTRAG